MVVSTIITIVCYCEAFESIELISLIEFVKGCITRIPLGHGVLSYYIRTQHY